MSFIDIYIRAKTMYTAFSGQHMAASGSLSEVVQALKTRDEDGHALLVFDDATGRCIDLDLRGTLEDALARLPASEAATPDKPGPGRPRLGVVAREVTLLPRHWEWLASQPGGASVALRKLVESASRASRAHDQARMSLEACHSFMSIMAGDLPGFEAASRALFAGQFDAVSACMVSWPDDIRAHAESMLLAARNDAYAAREDQA
jgi:hypothetical protein